MKMLLSIYQINFLKLFLPLIYLFVEKNNLIDILANSVRVFPQDGSN